MTNHLIEDLKLLLASGQAVALGDFAKAGKLFHAVASRPYIMAADVMRPILSTPEDRHRVLLSRLEDSHVTDHAERYLNAKRVAEALEPYAENPARDMSKYPCHAGLTAASGCGRCSRAIRAWEVMKDAEQTIAEYADVSFVIFSEFEYLEDGRGFWNNDDGWSEAQYATVFKADELLTSNLPDGHGVVWMSQSVANELFDSVVPEIQSAAIKP